MLCKSYTSKSNPLVENLNWLWIHCCGICQISYSMMKSPYIDPPVLQVSIICCAMNMVQSSAPFIVIRHDVTTLASSTWQSFNKDNVP